MNNHDARVYAIRVLMLGLDCSKLTKKGTVELTKLLDDLMANIKRATQNTQKTK